MGILGAKGRGTLKLSLDLGLCHLTCSLPLGGKEMPRHELLHAPPGIV